MSDPRIVCEESPCHRYKRFNTLIGSGSFKQVYLGFDVNEGKDVAWSEVSLEEATQEEKERFNNEVEILRSVHSDHIIQYYDSWHDTQRNRIIIITQYITSGTIAEYIQNKKISDDGIKKWCVQILQGLEYLHSRSPPIIHKDLKCSNLFIDGTSSSIRIGDLGLASHINKESIISGTLEYMSPETLDMNIYNEKTDMYAFGMCILELLTQSPPYSECSSTGELLSKVLNKIPPKALEDIKSSSFYDFVNQLIGPPEKRPSARDLLDSVFLRSEFCSRRMSLGLVENEAGFFLIQDVLSIIIDFEEEEAEGIRTIPSTENNLNAVITTSQPHSVVFSSLSLSEPVPTTTTITTTLSSSSQEINPILACTSSVSTLDKNCLVISLYAYKDNIYDIRFIRFQKQSVSTKTITRFAYCQDRIEVFVSSLCKLCIIPEIAIVEVCDAVKQLIEKHLEILHNKSV